MVIVLIPKIFLLGIFQKFSPIDSVGILIILFFPVALIWTVSRIKVLPFPLRAEKPDGKFNSRFALGLNVVALVILFLQFRDDLSLDFASHYDRRFLFREIAGSLGLQMYFINFFTSALAPFTAFVAMQRKNIALWALAIFSGLLMFAIDGQKFQFILIAAATGLGLVLFSKRDVSISFILFLMSAISVITIAETSLLASAVWSDWIFRRFVIVPSYITKSTINILWRRRFNVFGQWYEASDVFDGRNLFRRPGIKSEYQFCFCRIGYFGPFGSRLCNFVSDFLVESY